MEKENKIKILHLFNEKVSELLESRFTKSLSGSGVKITAKKGGCAKSERAGPDFEAIKSFAITIRNFMLDRDHISIRNIAQIYEKLDETDELNTEFSETRSKFNIFLDSCSPHIYNNKTLTNRQILDIYIYGEVIHLNKRDEFKKWISTSPLKDLMYNEIVYILDNVAGHIYFFNSINEQYLKRIEH